MPSEAEKQAADMAVARYGVERARVQQALEAVLQAQAQGKPANLLDFLVTENLLSPDQAQQVRLSLDKTQIDPGSAKKVSGEVPRPNGQVVAAEESSQEPRFLGEYHILRRLAEGGMGAVYLAYQGGENRQVAIKVLPGHLAGNQAFLDRFYREHKSGMLLNHPNIVRNINFGQDKAVGLYYLVLEYVDGPSAQGLLERFGKLAVGDAVHIILDIARALEHAHSRNIVHRDIKPGNILITLSGVAKLADLGLAKRTDETSHLTAARQGFGTPYYMPYEQAMNARSADGRSDIYALGATFYHLLTGEVPFPGVNHLEIVDKKKEGVFPLAGSLNPEIPQVLDRILEKMLAVDPRDRYQTASELIVDLERSGLSAQVPSFVDRDLALQDPLVRKRLTSPAQPTLPDLQQAAAANGASPLARQVWYLRYRDRKGQPCKAKASGEQIRQRLRDGKLSPQVEACRRPEGDYQPLAAYAEFREAINSRNESLKESPPPAKPTRKTLWLFFCLAGVFLLAMALYGFFFAN